MNISDLIYWDNSYNNILLGNLAIAIAIFASLRFVSGVISHVNPTKELLEKDNPAFGISIAAVVFSVSIVLSGAIYGDPIYALEDSIIAVGLYGVIGLAMLMVARVIFDKIAFSDISLKDEIVKGNVAVATIDAGNLIATAIIIRTMMVWVEANTLEGVITVLAGFVISQLLLTLTTIIRCKDVNKKNGGNPISEEFVKGNIALAFRFSGRKIGTAFAISAASNVLVFESYDMNLLLPTWAVVSVVMIAILTLLSFVANKVMFPHVNADDEVFNKQNTALGVIQAVTYISLGLLLAELMA